MTNDTPTPELSAAEQQQYGALAAFGLVQPDGQVTGFDQAGFTQRVTQFLNQHARPAGDAVLTGGSTLHTAHWLASSPRIGLLRVRPPTAVVSFAAIQAHLASSGGDLVRNPGVLGKFGAAFRFARPVLRFPVIGLAVEGFSDFGRGAWRRTTAIFESPDFFTGLRRTGEAAASVAGAGLLGSSDAGRGVFHMLNWADPEERERGMRMFLNNNLVSDATSAWNGQPSNFMTRGLNADQMRQEVFRELGVSNMLELGDFRVFKEKMLARLRAYKTPEREGEISHVDVQGGIVTLDEAIQMIEQLPDQLPAPIREQREQKERIEREIERLMSGTTPSAPAAAGGQVTATDAANPAGAARPEGGSGNWLSQIVEWISRQFERVASWFSSGPAPVSTTPRPDATPAAADSRIQPPESGYSSLGGISPTATNMHATITAGTSRGAVIEGAR